MLRVLRANVETLCMLTLMIPLNIVNIYVYITSESCSSNPDQLPTLARFIGVFSVISTACYPFLISKKLANFK